jgi:hypothetical protein
VVTWANAQRVIYFDTSFLAPLVLQEATSDRIAAFVRKLLLVELSNKPMSFPPKRESRASDVRWPLDARFGGHDIPFFS